MTRITYLRDEQTGLPIVCLAFNHQVGSNTFDYQMAILHPKEKCIKKTAVAIATGRLKKHPIPLSIPTDLDKFSWNLPALCKVAMARDIVNNSELPRRVIRLASRELDGVRAG